MKTTAEIRDLVIRNETHNVEFKRQFTADKIGQTIAAFANDWPRIGGGIILIGIDDKTKAVVGHQENIDHLQRNIADICRGGSLKPLIAPEIYEVLLEKPILVIEVQAINDPPCRYKDQCYIRIGATNSVCKFHEELALYKRASDASAVAGSLIDKLPPQEQYVDYFIGRRKELDELWQWFLDETARRRALSGDGGKGKSAIAYEFAHRIAEASPKPYDIALWASAKRRQFRSGQILPINNPDFSDLSTLLDKLLTDIGYPEETSLPREVKKINVLEYLSLFPALIVIDDLDSLDWSSDEEIMDFITFQLPQKTRCKILITSRRQIPGILTTFVQGFTTEDGYEFIRSKLQIAGMHGDVLTSQQMDLILRVTDSSPLYTEDLLRAFVNFGDIDVAIRMWKERGGDDAREYALKREIDYLGDDSVRVLLAFACLDHAVTHHEVKRITGLSDTKLQQSIDELQRLFLVPKPGLIEGLLRFSVNTNTKALILKVMAGTTELTEVKESLKSISGEVYQDIYRRPKIAMFIAQATGLIRSKQFKVAEDTILTGLQGLPQDPDLFGVLGWVYKCWEPQRITDAREKFQRAAELKCNNGEMYRHWYEMEERAGYWIGAIKAADEALKVFKDNDLWTYRYGDSQNKRGQQLSKEFQNSKAYENFRKSLKTMDKLATKLEATFSLRDRDILLNTYYAIISDINGLYKSTSLKKEQEDLSRQMSNYAEAILKRFGDDPAVKYAITKISERFPEIKLLL